jgi:hypothetical protein
MSEWKVGGKIQRRAIECCSYVRSGRPQAAICIEIKEQIDHLIRDNHRISIDETASEMSISHEKTRRKNGLNSKRNILFSPNEETRGPLNQMQ